jgi:PadR family transcriptional regulator, regulatory protein PadR
MWKPVIALHHCAIERGNSGRVVGKPSVIDKVRFARHTTAILTHQINPLDCVPKPATNKDRPMPFLSMNVNNALTLTGHRHNLFMPMDNMPKSTTPAGALQMLILRVLQSGSLHGYAIAQRIFVLSSEVLSVEEGLLYPTLQKMLLKGWVTAEWGISETKRKVRFYRLTRVGRKQLEQELSTYERVTGAIQSILRMA